MAEEKLPDSADKKNSRSPILESLNYLFYVSKVFGMIPYSLSDYITKKQFQLSQLGNIFCVLSCAHYVAQYHFLMVDSMLVKDPENTVGTLTTVIGLFIIYMEPLMLIIDVLASLINQKSLVVIFDRLREIDDKLARENILLNYPVIKKYSITFLLIAFTGEVSLGLFNLIVFHDDFLSLNSLWWLLSCVPLFCNAVAKTWFLILIMSVQQRLRAINQYLEETKKTLFERKMRRINAGGSNLKKDNLFIENMGYLEEIYSSRKMKIKSGNAWDWVSNSSMTNKVNDINIFTPNSRGIINVAPYDPNRKGENYRI
jgi:hypothetical protein